MSQLGLIWLLIAAPVLAIARDIVRYLAGRLDDPPKPAGVIPGERASRAAAAAAVIPSVYRHRETGPRLAVASTLPPAVPVAAVAGAAAAQAAATRRTTQP